MKRLHVYLLIMAAAVCGCKTERVREKRVDIRPGFFNNDLPGLRKVFESIETNKTTRADLGKMGITFPGKNVTVLEGSDAYKSIGGENVLQGLGDKLPELLPVMNKYILVEFKYTLTTNVTSKIYWQTKHTTDRGPSYRFTLVLKRVGNNHDAFDQQVVAYKAVNGEDLNRYERERSILQGPLEILNVIGGAAGNVTRVPGIP